MCLMICFLVAIHAILADHSRSAVVSEQDAPAAGKSEVNESPPRPGAANRELADLGIPFDGQPGPHNAITDVQGVEVGHTTLISGDGKLEVGKGPVRTGVTAILPRGKGLTEPVFAAVFSQNGNGD